MFHRTYLWRDENNFLLQFLAKAEFVLICLKKTNKHKLSNGFWLEFLLEIQSSYAEKLFCFNASMKTSIEGCSWELQRWTARHSLCSGEL